MPDGTRFMTENPRQIPSRMEDRLIVALDVPTIAKAERLIDQLDGIVSFYKIGLWLAFADGVDRLIRVLIENKKRVFLDSKMFDIGKTVEEGVARAADRGVSFVTVHGDGQIIESAVRGKRGSNIKIFGITVLTSLSDDELYAMGYRLTAKELVDLRVSTAIKHGCDGVIASADDNPNELRKVAGNNRLLIATPGIRPEGEAVHDHKRLATPRRAIEDGADYLVIGRPIIEKTDPAAAARSIIEQMNAAEVTTTS